MVDHPLGWSAAHLEKGVAYHPESRSQSRVVAATPEAKSGWLVQPPTTPGVVAPPPAPYMGWPATYWGGRPANEGFFFFF
jgi:hypothetical protein